MHVLLRSTKKRTRSGMRKGLSNRVDRVWPTRRFTRTWSGPRAAITTKRLQRRTTVRSNGNICTRHSRVLFDSRRTGSLRTSTETADSNDLPEVGMDVGIRDGNCINHRNAPGVRVFPMTTNSPSEKRLEELREQAWKEGVVAGKGVDVAGGPIPRKPGYYGQPVVKPPVWTWEIPIYFFMGGIAGMSAVIALAAVIFHHVDPALATNVGVARTAIWLAAIGVILSSILLIMDLGRPRLFLNMLRVFKYQSAMSMGAWILSLFGACAVPGLIALELHAHQIFPGALDQLLRVAAGIFIFGS